MLCPSWRRHVERLTFPGSRPELPCWTGTRSATPLFRPAGLAHFNGRSGRLRLPTSSLTESKMAAANTMASFNILVNKMAVLPKRDSCMAAVCVWTSWDWRRRREEPAGGVGVRRRTIYRRCLSVHGVLLLPELADSSIQSQPVELARVLLGLCTNCSTKWKSCKQCPEICWPKLFG